MGYSIRADFDREMDGQIKLHRFRYHLGKGFISVGDNVLDLGCGQAYGTLILADTALKVIGIDIDKDQILWNKEYMTGDNVDYVHANLETFNLPEFDVAVSFEVIEHLYKPFDFIQRLKKKVKKFIVVSVPIGETLVTVNGDVQASGDSTHHSSFPTPEYLDDMFIDGNWEQFFAFRSGVTYVSIYYNKEII